MDIASLPSFVNLCSCSCPLGAGELGISMEGLMVSKAFRHLNEMGVSHNGDIPQKLMVYYYCKWLIYRIMWRAPLFWETLRWFTVPNYCYWPVHWLLLLCFDPSSSIVICQCDCVLSIFLATIIHDYRTLRILNHYCDLLWMTDIKRHDWQLLWTRLAVAYRCSTPPPLE